MSRELSEDVAAILAAAGIRVVLFRTPVPTPLVGFAVKSLGAAGGVVVTASHNPGEYNGYKVYWENAAQIVPPVDARIAAAIDRAPPAREVTRPPLEALRTRALVTDATPDVERAYLDALRGLAVDPSGGDRSLRLVYTPLHGVGDALVRRALAEARFTDVTSVPEQREPDGAFPTVAFPNPEEPGAMTLAIALAQQTGAALVLANDPDADRLAVAVSDGDGYRQLTGNELGVLLGHYLLTDKPVTKPRAVLASIVSSPLLGRIASSLGVHYEETLTGFKWIANRAIELESEGFEFLRLRGSAGLLRRQRSARQGRDFSGGSGRGGRGCSARERADGAERARCDRAPLGGLRERAGDHHSQGRERHGGDPRDHGRSARLAPASNRGERGRLRGRLRCPKAHRVEHGSERRSDLAEE
jgi:phosphomannomutase